MCDLVALLTTLLMFVVTLMIPQKILELVIIIDQLNLSPGEINNLLLQKEIFWTSTLVITHNGLNSTHDWNRKRHTERPR